MSHLGLFFLGPPEVQIDHQPVTFPTRKSIALLAYLAVNGKSHPRDSLAALFWPELDQTRARASLRHALWTLGSAGLSDWLENDQELVRLKSGYDLDVAAFQEKMAQSQNHGHPKDFGCPECVILLTEAAGLYRGDFLAGFSLHDSPEFDDWQLFQAESLRHTLAGVLERLISTYNTNGDWEQAISYARQWVALDKLHEPAHRSLMQLYFQSGKRGLALKQYETLRQTLERELRVMPEAESQVLYEDILAGRIRTRTTTSSTSILPPSKIHREHNLPVQLTSFVGRKNDVAEITGLLQPSSLHPPTIRLVTITGPGGVGKTRLALEIASKLINIYPGGVWLVELSGLSDPSLAPKAVANALGVQEQTGFETTKAIINSLRYRPRLLLILDNCEHFLEACSDLVIALLKNSLELQLLITSRQVLGISAETIWPISGLSVYPIQKVLMLESKSKANIQASLIEQSDALLLFSERARLVWPSFVLTSQNSSVVAQICRRLDGLPLSIELAAARLNVLSLEAIAASLDDQFSLLRTKSRDIAVRHRTLYDVIDWSYQLLSETERVLFNRLCIFQGGFTLETVEAVCEQGTARNDLLDIITSLIEKSMVMVERGPRDGIRYQIFEALRQFGIERLVESGEIMTIRDQHSKFFMFLAEEVEPKLHGPDLLNWLKYLEDNYDNLRASLEWTLGRDGTRSETGLRIALALWYFWFIRAHLSEGRKWYEIALSDIRSDPALAALQAKVIPRACILEIYIGDGRRFVNLAGVGLELSKRYGEKLDVAFVLLVMGYLAHAQGDFEQMEALFEESLVLVRTTQRKWELALTLSFISNVFNLNTNFQKTAVTSAEALLLFRELGDKVGISYMLNQLGTATYFLGDQERGVALLEESLQVSQEVNFRLNIAGVLGRLTYIAEEQNDFNKAMQLHEERLYLYQEVGSNLGIVSEMIVIARLVWHQGDRARARELLEESLQIAREVGVNLWISLARRYLGIVTCLEGNTAEGRSHLVQSLAFIKAEDYYTIAAFIADITGLTLRLGMMEQAVRLSAFIQDFLVDAGMFYNFFYRKKSEYEQGYNKLMDYLGKEVFSEAWTEGKRMNIVQAHEYALEGIKEICLP